MAAGNHGIRIVEVQHGVINDLHPGYGETFNKGRNLRECPDEYWVWDQESKKTLGKWCKDNIKVEIKGNMWLDRFIRRSPLDDVVRSALTHLPKLDPTKGTILVTSQSNLGFYLGAHSRCFIIGFFIEEYGADMWLC